MKSRLQLLAILKYIMEESSENSPVRILSPSHLVKEYSEKLDRMRKIVKCV